MASLLSWGKRLAHDITHNNITDFVGRDVVKPVVHQAQGSLAQINPADGGRTYQTVMQNKAAPKPYVSAIDQLTHNGATNLTGGIVKPLFRTGLAVNQGIGNLELKLAGRPTQNAQQAFGDLATYSGYTGTKRQIAGDTANTALTALTGGTGKVISKSFQSVAPKVVPKVITKTVANAGTGAVVGAPFGATTYLGSDQPVTMKGLKDATVQGAKAGAVLGGGGTLAGAAAPHIARGAAKAAQKTPEVATKVNRAVNPINAQISDHLAMLEKSKIGKSVQAQRQIDNAIKATIEERARINQKGAVGGEGLRLPKPSGDNTRPSASPTRLPATPGMSEDHFFQTYKPELTNRSGSAGRGTGSPETPTPLAKILEQLPQERQVRITEPGSIPSAKPLPVYNTKQVSKLDKAARSTRGIIERQGDEGKRLGSMLQGARDSQELQLAALQKQLPTVFKIANPKLLKSGLKDKWTNHTFENFVEAAQGLAEPKTPAVAQAVKEWQSVHPTIRQRAVDAGLQVGDLGQKYYPHFIDYAAVFKDTNTYNKALNHLVESGQAADHEAAIKLLNHAKDVSRNRQFGNLESERLIDLPMYDKTPNSLLSYLNGSAKRISQTETFGAGDENALKLITKAGTKGYDTEAMKNAYDIAVGAKQYNPTSSAISGGIRKYITTTRLGLGALTNISQNVNTGIVTGHLRTMGAALKQFDPKTRAFVGDTGVIADAVLSDLRTQTGYSSFSSKVFGKVVNKITAPGFGTVEKMNRSIAATAGRDYALRLAQKGDEATLRRIGVTGQIKNKTLTVAQQIQAARKVVEKTQFKVDAQDLPGWADSPGGKMVAQFRTFSYKQGSFFSNEIVKPAAKGNFLPLSRFLAVLPVGLALYETKRVIAGRPEEEDKKKTGLQVAQNIGGFGLVTDLYQSLNPLGSKYIPSDRRLSMTLGSIGGPAAGVGGQAVGAVSDLIQRKNTPTDESRLDGKVALGKTTDSYTDATPAARFAIQQLPVAGTAIKNRLLPFQKESDADAGKTKTLTSGTPTPPDLKDKKMLATAFGDTFAALKNDEARKEWARESPDNKAIYNNYLASKRSLNPSADIPEGLSTDSTKTLKQYAKMTDAGRERLIKTQSDAEFKLEYAKYERDLKSGNLSTVQKIKKQNELQKLKVGSVYPKEVRDMYSLSKGDAYAYLTERETGIDKGKLSKQLIAYDTALHDAGLTKYLKYKNGIAPSKGRGGRSGTGKASLNSVLATLKSSNDAAKPLKQVSGPNITVKTTTSPSTYKKTLLRQYAVKKPTIGKTKRT